MTGPGSRYRSVALAALACGCYAEPDVQIAVTRDVGSGYNLGVNACTSSCDHNFVFPDGSGDTQRDVFIFVERDRPTVRLELDRDSPSCWRGCITIPLAGDTVHRSMSLTATLQPGWSGGGESFDLPGTGSCGIAPCP
jgi:hypothetical protein